MQLIHTPRLVLRPFELSDSEALFQINANPQVMKYITTPDQNLAQTREFLRHGPLNDYQQYGYGRLACFDKSSQKLIGFCGIKYLPTLGEKDIGYRFLPEYWGQGIATEACNAVIDYTRENTQLDRLVGLALPDNKASIHIFKKLGMHYEKQVVSKGDLCVMYAVDYSKTKDTKES